MPDQRPTDDPDQLPTEPDDDAPGEPERTKEGMAPLVTNTGDDDDEGAPTG